MERFSKMIVLLLVAMAIGGVQLIVNNFTATSTGNEIKLNWIVDSELELQNFELSRKSPSDNSYLKIVTIAPNGTGEYQYIDALAAKQLSTGSTNGYSYKLVARSANNAFTYYSSTGGATAVQRSWGSIKSMFK
jgi:hypothetical protein